MMAVTFTLAYAPSIIVIAVENIWPTKIDFYDSENYSAQFSMFSCNSFFRIFLSVKLDSYLGCIPRHTYDSLGFRLNLAISMLGN